MILRGKEIKEFSCILQAYTLRWLASLSPYVPGYVLDKVVFSYSVTDGYRGRIVERGECDK